MVQAMYKLGKQAVSGLCECTSIIGPLMGGGHSALQGFHGFVSDNILSARVILADGSAVTASDEDNCDLFWALRGAGKLIPRCTGDEISGSHAYLVALYTCCVKIALTQALRT